MENNKNLENYVVRENNPSGIDRLVQGLVGLGISFFNGQNLAIKTLEIASKMYNCMQTNSDFNFYTNFDQFCSTSDGLTLGALAFGVGVGGAYLVRSLYDPPKYEIHRKESDEEK